MCDRNSDPTTYDLPVEQKEVTAFVLVGEPYGIFEREAGLTAPVTSPWVQRNNDYAQYPQPRGSEYEG